MKKKEKVPKTNRIKCSKSSVMHENYREEKAREENKKFLLILYEYCKR